ncbi:MAG: hypothetical protein LKJ83_09395 [Eubacteriaceae bacterium]|jgi:dipeptidase D|nr:hypothetical protein [Eubacteriaceae bacterium]
MKKAFSIIVSASLVCTLLLSAGCTSKNDEISDKTVKNDIYDTYEEIKDVSADAKNAGDISAWVLKWAKKNDIAARNIGNDNLVLSKDATAGYEKAGDSTLQCSITGHESSQDAQVLAIALSSLKDTTNHGKIDLLITADASAVSTGYLKSDNLLNLSYGKNTKLFTGSASTAKYTIYRTVSKTSTTGDQAYRITIGGFEGGNSGDRSRTHPNPIESLASLVNSCQSSNMVIEVAGFRGGSSFDTYPTSASVTVVIDKNDITKFEKKVANAKSDYQDKYVSKESNMTYTLTKVKKPAKVYSTDDTSNVLSLMYTMSDGVYATIDGQDSGDSIAVTNLGRLTLKGTKFKAEVSARSIDADEMKTMNKEFKATAKLNDMHFRISRETPLWPYNNNSTLAKDFETASDEYGFSLDTSSTYMQNDCALFYSKDNSLNMISLYTNIEDGYSVCKSIILFYGNMGK